MDANAGRSPVPGHSAAEMCATIQCASDEETAGQSQEQRGSGGTPEWDAECEVGEEAQL